MTERLMDLLAARATQGLTEEEQVELDHNLPNHPELSADDFDLAAAAAALAFDLADSEVEPMPADLKQRILQQSEEHLGPRPVASAEVTPSSVSPFQAPPKPETRSTLFSARNLGWYAAAAMLVLALWAPWRGGEAVPTFAEQRDALLQEASDTLQVSWAKPEIAEYAQVEGDVVWSNSRQQGFMRLRGLPENIPAEAQYQLWIVDPTRDEHPIDGGVFDVQAGTGEVIVPIDAKLDVNQAAAFAITLEQPGGVVVSDGPLLVIAAVDAA